MDSRTVPFLGSFHFNVLLGNSALYGSLPWHWYITAGIPAITGLWFPFVLLDFGIFLARKNDKPSFAHRNLWIIVLTFTATHSLGPQRISIPHADVTSFCLLAGPHVQATLMFCSRKRSTEQSKASNNDNLHNLLPWLALMAIPNLIAVLYLGLFHQSAPISVNHKIAAMAAQSLTTSSSSEQSPTPTTFTQSNNYSIHYLTGACHSTPLHSYLHVPGPLQFDTWSLDCSPDCRANLDDDVLCESEEFAKDPVGFVEAAYFQNSPCQSSSTTTTTTTTSNGEDESERIERSCSAFGEGQPYPRPDFLVTYSDYASKLQPQIKALGLQEVGRFSHGINGLRIGSLLKTGDGYASTTSDDEATTSATYRRIRLLGDYLELSIDEMVLYASPACYSNSLD